MVTYWLEGNKNSVGPKDVGPDVKTTKHAETEKEQELYSSMPGYLNEDLLLDPAWSTDSMFVLLAWSQFSCHQC